ncbi:MAG: DAK2 domain-containing protein [Candidatus Bruticola sp.]
MKDILDGKLLKKLFLGGGRWLTLHKQLLNEINIFPVPDRDTGFNMSFTARGAVKFLSGQAPASLALTAQRAARGAIMEAHGNSGVIFSQILHGFACGLEDKITATPSELSAAFSLASETAYNSLQTPWEGTILSFIRLISRESELLCQENSHINLVEFLVRLTEKGRLFFTSQPSPTVPEVLYTTGIVDAGALGLYCFFEGMSLVAQGRPLRINNADCDWYNRIGLLPSTASFKLATKVSPLLFKYCSEFTLTDSSCPSKAVLERELAKLGNSVIISSGQNLLKIHLHTNTPNLVEKLLTNYGKIISKKTDNLDEQCSDRLFNMTQTSLAAVSPGLKEEKFSMISQPISSQREKLQLQTAFVCPWGDGFDEYFQDGWGFVVLPFNQNDDPPNWQLLKKTYLWADTNQNSLRPTLFANPNFFIKPSNRAILTSSPAIWSQNCPDWLQLCKVQNPIQLLALLTSKNFNGCFNNLSNLIWGDISKSSNLSNEAKFEGNPILIVKKNGDCLGRTNCLSEAIELFIESLPSPPGQRLLLAAGLECTTDAAEEAIEELMGNWPQLLIQLFYGGQPDSEMLVYAE